MANSTTWKTGQSGNPKGRPPKGRALTELLAAVGNEPCSDGKGGTIPKNRLLAQMIWGAVTSGEVTFHATNREFGASKTRTFKSHEWFEIVKWLFAQIDGELRMEFREEEPEEDDTPGAEPENVPDLQLPDNGRETKEKEKPEEKPTTE